MSLKLIMFARYRHQDQARTGLIWARKQAKNGQSDKVIVGLRIIICESNLVRPIMG